MEFERLKENGCLGMTSNGQGRFWEVRLLVGGFA